MIINPVEDLLLSLADGASQPASLLAQWLQQPVPIHHDLAVWLSFDAQMCAEVPGDPGQASPNPIIMTIMTIMKIFSRLYLPQPRKPKPARPVPSIQEMP